MYSDHDICDYEKGSRYATVQYSKLAGVAHWESYGKFFHGITYM